MHAVKNVETDTKTEPDSDHYQIITEIKIKLKANRKKDEEQEVWKQARKTRA